VISPIPGGPSLLLALPPGAAHGQWLDDWRGVLDAWPGDWHILDPDPNYERAWRRRALEHCAGCWTALPDPGATPGAIAFSLALRAMAEDPRLACVCIVPTDVLASIPELRSTRSPFYEARFAPGGVSLVKGPLAAKEALPEPRFHPYDFAEATFRMTQRGLRVLVLPDPSFSVMATRRPPLSRLQSAWLEGRGSTAFRLAHKGAAPRSLRLPRSRLELLLLGLWLVPSTAVRTARKRPGRRGPARVLLDAAEAAARSAALWAGAPSAYSLKRKTR